VETEKGWGMIESRSSYYKYSIFILITAAFIRLTTLGAYPLTDNTEARYAEVAREMLSSGDWVSPHLHSTKFWAKPPLSIWMTAGSMALFGKKEFAARFPHLLMSLLAAGLTFLMAAKQRGNDYALAATAVLATSILFFISSGAVMTDSAFVFATTLSMISFWLAVNGKGKVSAIWGYLFFIALAIGLLAKGPVGPVLTFLPIGLWAFWKKQWGVLWHRMPWLRGLLITAAISLPW